jgi:hypothetical protein
MESTNRKITVHACPGINPDPIQKITKAGHWWLTFVILATREAEIRKITVQGQPRQVVHAILAPKITRAK